MRSNMKKVIIAVVAFIVIAGLIGAGSSETKTEAPKENVAVAENKSLAAEVEKAYLAQIGYSSITELNLDAENIVDEKEQSIIKFEDQGKGNVNVTAQANLSRDELRTVGYSVLTAVSDVDGLESITVWGSNGIHRTVYLKDIQ